MAPLGTPDNWDGAESTSGHSILSLRVLRGSDVRDLSDVSLRPSDFAAMADLCKQDRDFPRNVAGDAVDSQHAGGHGQSETGYQVIHVLGVAGVVRLCLA